MYFWTKDSKKKKTKFRVPIRFKTLFTAFSLQLLFGGTFQGIIIITGNKQIKNKYDLEVLFKANCKLEATKNINKLILGTNPLLGLLNVSLAAMIMLTTFLVMDEEAIKYLKRKTNNLFKMEPFGNYYSPQSDTKTRPRKQKETKSFS